ncbi:MAG: hypothetical protein ACKPKO_16275 [Candidatus Fonsibacter sp.]
MKYFHLRQIQHLQQQLDAIETIQNYNLHRDRLLQQQNNKNYRHEYERPLGELSQNTNLHAATKKKLHKRKAVLKQILDTSDKERQIILSK